MILLVWFVPFLLTALVYHWFGMWGITVAWGLLILAFYVKLVVFDGGENA